ncbi:Cobalamin biosynthesis cobW [Amphidinium carterae]
MPKQVPVTILTGFLGSGKTTLMNHILQSPDHKLRFAIIENEFGEVGVDEKVLAEEANDEVIEVMNGCICCTVRGDLVEALKRLHGKVSQFDAVLIETTGLADPAPVAQTFFVDDFIQANYKLDGIVTVVDSKHVMEHLEEEKPEGVENECAEQVAFADRILLNKTDLVEAEELDKLEVKLKSMNKNAEIFRTQHSKIDPLKLLNIGAFNLERVLEMDPEFLNTDGEHQHDSSVSSISFKFTGELNIFMLQEWIGELMQTMSNDLFRYKGVIAVCGKEQKWVFQGVHMLFAAKFSDTKWKNNEDRECRFVFIGRNLDKKVLEEGFMQCKVTRELRSRLATKWLAAWKVASKPAKCSRPGMTAIATGSVSILVLKFGRPLIWTCSLNQHLEACYRWGH